MDAITKNRQTKETIYQMVERAFGKEQLCYEKGIVELEGGFCNVVYLVPLKDQEVILKIAPSDEVEMMSYEKGLLETEVTVMKQMEQSTHVPVPKVLFMDDSKEICNSSYFFMTKAEGKSYVEEKEKMTKEEQEQVMRELGEYNKQINQLTGNYFGLLGKEYRKFNTCKEFILDLFHMLLADGQRKGSKLVHISYEDLWYLIVDNATVFEEVTIPRLVHWDLWDGNIFVKEGHISCIIDHERGFYGDYLMEDAFSSFGDSSTVFLQSYGKESFTSNEMVRRTIYRLYRCVVMIVECDFRKYDSDGQYQWMIETLDKELQNLREQIKNVNP